VAEFDSPAASDEPLSLSYHQRKLRDRKQLI
jgi:hypothetical protein